MRLVKIFFVVLVLTALILGLAPFLIKHYVIAQLDERGFKTDIKEFGLNLVTGRLVMQGLTIRGDGGEKLTAYEIKAPFSPMKLLQKNLDFGAVEFTSLSVDVKKGPQGWMLAGFPVKKWQASTQNSGWRVDLRRIGFDTLALCRTSRNQCLQIEQAALSNIQWRDGSGLQVKSASTANKMFFRDQNDGSAIFYLGEFSAASMSLLDKKLSLTDLQLTNFQFVETPAADNKLPDTPYQTQIGSLEVNNLSINYKDNLALRLGEVDVISLRQALQKNSDALFVMPYRIQSWFPELNGIINNKKGGATLALKSLQVSSGVMSWLDNSVSPPAAETLTGVSVKTGAIDSTKPTLKTPVSFAAKVGAKGAIKLEGEMQVYNPKRNFDLTGFIRNFDLSRLAAYSSYLLGEKLTAGVVDASLDITVQNDVLSGLTVWRLSDFNLVSGTAEKSQHMSMQRSIALLKDQNDSVQVELPLKGHVKDQNITIKKVLSESLRGQLSQMARYRSNPINAQALPSVASVKPAKMTFTSLAFPSQKTKLDSQGQERLKAIAEKLKAKSYLKMEFCPISTGGEWGDLYNSGLPAKENLSLPNEQKTALLKLGGARGEYVRQFLIKQGVAAKQIEVCGPSLQISETGPSYVSVAI